MKPDKFKNVFLCLIVFALIVVSCQKKPDFSLIESKDCMPPCWKGITPGSTTEDDATAQLLEMDEVKHSTIKRGIASHLLFADQIYWDFEKGSFGRISVDEEIVVEISLGKVNVKLNDLVDLFGEPEQIMFLPYNGREWRVIILYAQQGIWLDYIKENTNNGTMINLSPNDLVENINFYSPDAYNELLIYSANSFLKQESLQFQDILQPWNGYREEEIIASK